MLYVVGAALLFLSVRSVYTQITNFLVIILVSLFVSFAVEPAVDYLADRGWRRGLATGLVFLGVTILAALLVYLVVDLLITQISQLVEDAPRLIRELVDWVNRRFNANITADSLTRQLERYQDNLAAAAGDVGGRVVSITGSVVGLLFNGLTIALFSFYLVADGPKLRRSVCSVLPPRQQKMVVGLWELSIRKTGGYLYSRVLLAALNATFTWFAFLIIGLPSPLALAVFAGIVSQFVPVIGTYIAGALPVLIALLNDPVKALWVIGYLVIYQQVENYLFSPRISARTMEIHPAVAFGSVFVGANLLGAVGAFLALPAAAIVQAFVSSYLHRYELIEEDALAG
jgi:predicted PurR-regulated permease PerM